MNAPYIAQRAALSRRTFLKGVGVALSLPWLESMAPGFGAYARTAAATSPRRFVTFCASLGYHGPFFFPRETGPGYTPSLYLDVLKEFRGDFTVFSGLSHPSQHGSNGHASSLTWLTAAQRPGLPGFKNSISLDQAIAQHIGRHTREPFLSLATSGGSLSWTPNGVEIPAETSPSRLYTRLFLEGSPDETSRQIRALQSGRSILDTVHAQAKSLHASLPAADRAKLGEYLDSVRGLEQRLVENEAWVQKPKPPVDAPPPTDIQNRNDAIGRTRLMNDMIVLALLTDSTRTITFNLNGLNAVPVVEGVDDDWHNLSHHGRDEAKIEELKLIELAQFAAFRDFLGKLKAATDSGGTPLLDSTTVLFGSNLGNASSHEAKNLPILVAGGGFRHGSHIAFDSQDNEPLCNLFLSLARQTGVPLDRFGSSTRSHLPGFEGAKS